MSRFSPDTWIDALLLPIAMVQFRGNVYVESIAPDIRPVAAIVLIILVVILRVSGLRKFDNKVVNTRALLTILVSSVVAFFLWILTSANGRYGFFALFLTSILLTALMVVMFRTVANAVVALISVFLIQLLFLNTVDIGEGWLTMTNYRWQEKYADKYKDEELLSLRQKISGHSVAVVLPRINSGMSTLQPIFGDSVSYINIKFLENATPDSKAKAKDRIANADLVYLAMIQMERFELNEAINHLVEADHELLKEFGLIANTNGCELYSSRMGFKQFVCALEKKEFPLEIISNNTNPERIRILSLLQKRCPDVFGASVNGARSVKDELIYSANDNKYFVLISKDMDVWVRHRSKLNFRKILTREKLGRIPSMTCGEIIDFGLQYW